MALPVPDGRLGLLDDVHDPAAELRIEVQVVDVRPKIGKRAIIQLREMAIPLKCFWCLKSTNHTLLRCRAGTCSYTCSISTY